MSYRSLISIYQTLIIHIAKQPFDIHEIAALRKVIVKKLYITPPQRGFFARKYKNAVFRRFIAVFCLLNKQALP